MAQLFTYVLSQVNLKFSEFKNGSIGMETKTQKEDSIKVSSRTEQASDITMTPTPLLLHNIHVRI